MSAPRAIRLLSLAGLGLLTTCDNQNLGPLTDPTAPTFEIIDAAHNAAANPHFYFLPPLVPSPSYGGTFDASLSPVVQICEWTGTACVDPPIAEFTTTTGPGSETVRLVEADQHYIVNWHTDAFALDPETMYRISVLVAGTHLGHADVDVVTSGRDLKNVATGEYVALKDDRTLPIKFRIEQGAVTVVGTTGGTVAFGGGAATIVLAEGSLSGTVGLTGWPTTDYPDTADLISETVYRFGPEGLTFNEGNPATLTISYDPASPPTDKYPWLHKVVNGKWVRAPGSTADLTAGSVSAPITGFSTFAVVKIACHADITGTVTVAGVVPLKGIMISATRAGGGTSIGAVTRSDGSYHMILPVVLGLPATWTVTAQVLGYGLQVQATVTVAPCVTTTTVDLTVKLETVLEATPRLADFIVWETPYAPVAYRDWSSSEKDELEAYFVAALSGGASLSDPPTNLAAGSLPDGTFAETVLAPDAAWALYLANVGHSLAMEYSEQLAWSLTGYSDTALSILLDGRSFLKWVEHWSGVSGYQLFHPRETGGFVVRDVLPAPPSATYGFLTQHNIVSGDRVSTIARVFDWAREHMFHYRGNQLAENMEDHWQYRGSAPASRILSGTVRQSDGRFGSWTPGCHGTNWFLQDLLRAVNIPVQYRSGGGHATPFFIADGLALSHGDDLYTSFARIYSVGQPIPSEEFFIDEATWDAWFDPSVPYSDQQTNVGRRVSENAVAYLPDYLLYLRCEDINTGRSPGESGILESLGRHFQLAELEAANLWPRTDAKIATLGGCPSICPTWSTALSCHSSLEVATVTTGLGPSAYVVLVDGVEAAVTSVSGTATLYELWGRSYSVELSGLGSDCTVDGANPRSITLQPGETGHTTFDVSCGMPVIDGVLSPGEWDRAVEILVRDFGEYTGTTVYAMSDVSNVYFALRIPQPAPTSGDRFLVRFDNANNGVLELNEDQICAATPPSDWFDCHSYQSSEGMSWGAVDVQQDGSSAMTSDVAWKTFEVARPLSSGDPYDFSLVPGDIVGFCAAYFTGSSYVDYPAGCIYAGSDLSGYAELEVGGQ